MPPPCCLGPHFKYLFVLTSQGAIKDRLGIKIIPLESMKVSFFDELIIQSHGFGAAMECHFLAGLQWDVSLHQRWQLLSLLGNVVPTQGVPILPTQPLASPICRTGGVISLSPLENSTGWWLRNRTQAWGILCLPPLQGSQRPECCCQFG